MATALDNDLKNLQAQIALFARDVIGVRPNLNARDDFPWDVWEKMQERGLFGIGVLDEFGESNKGFIAQAVAGEALVRQGGNLGLAVSLALHWIVSGVLILKHANLFQNQAYLPSMGEGGMIGALGVTEKGGARPVDIKTTAVKDGAAYVINGEKTFVTNGPLADLFIVMAKTGEAGGRSELTAFLVPVDAPGLTVGGPIPLGFLKPSPHGGVTMENVRVPETNILGKIGKAYETMIKPFRLIEDVVFMGPMAGGLARQLDIAAELAGRSGVKDDQTLKIRMGRLLSILDSLRIMAYECARILDSHVEHVELTSLVVAGRWMVQAFQDEFGVMIKDAGLEPTPHLNALTKDLVETNKIAGDVLLKKQEKMGEAFIMA